MRPIGAGPPTPTFKTRRGEARKRCEATKKRGDTSPCAVGVALRPAVGWILLIWVINVGGLIGNCDYNITNSYAVAVVSGNSVVGGLIGSGTSTSTNAYWNVDSTMAIGAGGTDKTTCGLKLQSSFTGWDFTSTWAIHPLLTSCR